MTGTYLTLATNRRLWRRNAWIVAGGLVVGGVVGSLSTHQRGDAVLGVVATMLALAGFAGSFSLVPTTFGRSDDLRLPLLGLD